MRFTVVHFLSSILGRMLRKTCECRVSFSKNYTNLFFSGGLVEVAIVRKNVILLEMYMVWNLLGF